MKSTWSGSSFSVVGVFGSDGGGSTGGGLGEGGRVGAGRVGRSGGGEGGCFFSSCLFCSFGFDARGSSDGPRGSSSVEEDVGGGGLRGKERERGDGQRGRRE